MSQDEDEFDEYNDYGFDENQGGDFEDDEDDTDDDTEDDEYEDDYKQVKHDLLYKCRCKWKGGSMCLEAFEDEDAMWDHLINIHKTNKWLVQLYKRIQ